jgi:hypothetical protein
MRRCSLCNWSDERALSQVSLADGTRVTVCGSHYVVHQRVGRTFPTLGAMRQELGERRRYQERRAPSRFRDELAMQLTAAFTMDRRAGVDRRR